MPRYVALGLAAACSLASASGWRSASRTGADEARQALSSRRDTLLRELAQLEAKRRAGAVDADALRDAPAAHPRASSSRIYGELDEAGAGPQGGGEGVAA